MTLPKEISEQIIINSVAYANMLPFYSKDIQLAHDAGATEWAPWFVKYTAIESELFGVRAENEKLKKGYHELKWKAEGLVKALEWIKTYGPCDDLTVKFIDNILNKYKEVLNG